MRGRMGTSAPTNPNAVLHKPIRRAATRGHPYGAEDTMGAGFLSYPSTSIRMGIVITHPTVDRVAPMAA